MKAERVVQAMQNIMQNPEFAKMAEDLGKKMFENDPQLASMVQVCLLYKCGCLVHLASFASLHVFSLLAWHKMSFLSFSSVDAYFFRSSLPTPFSCTKQTCCLCLS
jgi:hypothetical protein